MNLIITHLTRFRNRFFKLLPMREDWEAGANNHLPEYLENFYTNISGLFIRYPELNGYASLLEAYNNLAVLCNSVNEINFQKWRSIVLRSTKLIATVLEEYTASVPEISATRGDVDE